MRAALLMTLAFTPLAAARPPLRVQEITLQQGGQNTGVWEGVLPQVLQWIGAGT